MNEGREQRRVVIVEGTCGAGKTTLLRSLPATFSGRKVKCFSQHDTYAPIVPAEDDGTLDDELNRAILCDVLHTIAVAVAVENQLVVVDTLHFTHFVRAGALSLNSFHQIDRAVGKLEPIVVVLRLGRQAIRQRTIDGRRHTGFYAYAQKFADDDEGLVDYFFREQDRIIDLLRVHSGLHYLVLDGERSTDELRAELEFVLNSA